MDKDSSEAIEMRKLLFAVRSVMKLPPSLISDNEVAKLFVTLDENGNGEFFFFLRHGAACCAAERIPTTVTSHLRITASRFVRQILCQRRRMYRDVTILIMVASVLNDSHARNPSWPWPAGLGELSLVETGASPVVYLVTFPGSGNTWIRHLIQTGTHVVSGGHNILRECRGAAALRPPVADDDGAVAAARLSRTTPADSAI